MLAGLLQLVAIGPSSATDLGTEGKIVFVRQNQIYTSTKTGSGVQKLTSVGKNYRPKWSPSGQAIAYLNEDSTGHVNVFKMSATGSSKTKVTTSGHVTTAPVWSPDGKTIAFAQTGSFNWTPFCNPNCAYPYGGTYSGNYVFLVKSTSPFGTPSPLIVYPSYDNPWDSSEPITAYTKSSLAWSPNGADLAIVNGDSEDSPDTGMHFVHGMVGATAANASTVGRAEDVVDFTGGDCCGYQDWSDVNYIPNGTLGWAVVDHGDELMYDPNPHILLNFRGFASQQGDKAGAPSPSGAHVVFVRNSGTTTNIWTSTMTGSSRRQILANGYQPDWQPLP